LRPLTLNLERIIKRIRHTVTKSKLRIPLVWFRHRGIRPTDVLVASYPRSGSTWLRFLLFQILTQEPAQFETVDRVIPRPARQAGAPRLLPGRGRLIQTHEVYRPEYQRAIYLVRDVRDVVVSEYNYQRGQGLYTKGLEDFVEAFLQGRVNGYGPWSRNVLSWLDAAPTRRGDVLVIQFKELRQDPQDTLTKILDFLDTNVDASSIQSAIQANTVDKMREKESRARDTVFKIWGDKDHFVRSGAVGGWRQTLTEEQIRLVEGASRETLLRLGYPISDRFEGNNR
jgi:hypothetical protein